MIRPAALLLGIFVAWGTSAAQTPPDACNRTQNLAWVTQFFGDTPIIATAVQNNVRTQKTRVCGLQFPVELPPPDRSVPNQPWEQVADDVSGFVNVYRLTSNTDYKDLAQYAADWLAAWNDYLVLHADPSIPYLGWGVDSREGWFNLTCAASYGFRDGGDNRSYFVDGWRADEAWDTAATVRGLLKYSTIDPAGVQSAYFQRAKQILASWPLRDHTSGDGNPDVDLANDGPYAASGMRWYAKSNEPCEIRYVKNTDIVMGEQLFREYQLTQDPQVLQAATRVLYAQLWDIISHRNFGYNSFILYRYRSGTIFADVMVPDNESRTVVHINPGQPDETIVCKNPQADSSCWDHLGFEAYDLYLVQQLIANIPPDSFPVPGTPSDVATAIGQTMYYYRTSIFGDTSRFPWGQSSPTHIVAYNCAQRFSGDQSFQNACVAALQSLTDLHLGTTGGTIFYSLVPDALFN